jgi:hypothetical protein
VIFHEFNKGTRRKTTPNWFTLNSEPLEETHHMTTIQKTWILYQRVIGIYRWYMDICGGVICSYLIISDPFGFLKRVTKMFVEKNISSYHFI